MSIGLYDNPALIIRHDVIDCPDAKVAFPDPDSSATLPTAPVPPVRYPRAMSDSETPSRRAGAGSVVTAVQVADALRLQIQEAALQPGEWLREARLCSEFGVGRSIARTALRTLADDGLVVIEENRGAYVAGTTVQEVFDLYEVRAALYGLAARFACIRATPQHMAETLKLVDELLAASRRGESAVELIHQSEVIFSRLASASSPA